MPGHQEGVIVTKRWNSYSFEAHYAGVRHSVPPIMQAKRKRRLQERSSCLKCAKLLPPNKVALCMRINPPGSDLRPFGRRELIYGGIAAVVVVGIAVVGEPYDLWQHLLAFLAQWK